jgi:tetratricopeptide (TPR) repeat protein
MKQEYDFLPRRLTKEEIALAPTNWVRVLSHYSYYRRRALWGEKPGYYALLAGVMAGIAKKDRHLIDVASALTKDNLPRYVHLSLVGSALGCLGAKKEGLRMAREAVKLDQSPSTLLALAADTDDLDETESLAQRVLSQNPDDCDALRHLAYAKYIKGEREEAECLIDKVLSTDPNNIYALENKASSCFNRGEYLKALDYLLKISLKPPPVSLQLKVCHCYYLLGKARKAKRIAKQMQDKISRAYDLGIEIEDAHKLLTEILNS